MILGASYIDDEIAKLTHDVRLGIKIGRGFWLGELQAKSGCPMVDGCVEFALPRFGGILSTSIRQE